MCVPHLTPLEQTILYSHKLKGSAFKAGLTWTMLNYIHHLATPWPLEYLICMQSYVYLAGYATSKKKICNRCSSAVLLTLILHKLFFMKTNALRIATWPLCNWIHFPHVFFFFKRCYLCCNTVFWYKMFVFLSQMLKISASCSYCETKNFSLMDKYIFALLSFLPKKYISCFLNI